MIHTFHGHVLTGYFGAGRTAFFREVERTLARVSDVLVAVSPEVRDELVELGVAPRDKFAVIRLGIPLEERLGVTWNADLVPVADAVTERAEALLELEAGGEWANERFAESTTNPDTGSLTTAEWFVRVVSAPDASITDRLDARLIYIGGALLAAAASAGFALFATGFWSAIASAASAVRVWVTATMPPNADTGSQARARRYAPATSAPSRAPSPASSLSFRPEPQFRFNTRSTVAAPATVNSDSR